MINDISVKLSYPQWQHILELIENDIEYGRDMFTTRYNLRIYDEIYKYLEKADKENKLNR